MVPTPADETLHAWEREILFRHRWGQHGEERAQEELERLGRLREAAGPLDGDAEAVLEQIAGPEICNWRLEEMVLALCEAIGRRRPVAHPTGHLATMTAGRWARVWAYYLSCRDWLAAERRGRAGWDAMLARCDAEGEVRRHVAELLDEPTELKALYVRRFCLCMEYWLDGLPRGDTPEPTAEAAQLEEAIRRRGGEDILGAFRHEGSGRLQVCHHKVFRRYDIILSSIGAGRWRAAMPQRGTDGFDRAAEIEPLLAAIENWSRGEPAAATGDSSAQPISQLLGEPTATKIFQAELLASLLRSQQLAARQRAEKRRSATPP